MQLHGHWYRGGTSKCWLFDAADIRPLAASRDEVRALLADAFGAGDPRQLDGVGGGTSTTSKAAVITATPGGPADLDYLFAQVGLGDGSVEFGSNCGNCATAIALHAVQSGLVPVRGETTRVIMRNSNTGAVLSGSVPTPGGRVPERGTATVPGSKAPGVPVALSFHAPWGQTTGSALPTGSDADSLPVEGEQFTATMVDAGAPAVFLAAEEIGADLSSMADDMAPHLGLLLAARASAALRMGLRGPSDPPQHAVPKVGVVGPAGRYTAADGSTVSEASHDVRVRMISMLAPHPAIGLTSAVALAFAASQPGSVVAKALPSTVTAGSGPRPLRIGTPAGVVTAEVHADANGRITEIALHRAARHLADAEIDVVRGLTL